MKKYYIGICFLLSLFLLHSCAQIGTITGGEKDTQPPKILKQIPENNTTNFKNNTISITFDEYVELVNPTETFLLSPLSENTPEVSIKGKTVVIDLKECNLKENTTYILSCEKGIKDFTEGNMLPSSKFVFSTGDFIDSMLISGNIKNALTLSAEKNVAVFLHAENEDSTLKNTLPLYITYTDDKGNFCFSNLPNQPFYISALVDKNSNNLFDQADEQIAFINQAVEPTVANETDTNNNRIIDYTQNELKLFTEDDTVLKFIKRDLAYDFVHKFIFKNKVEDFSLQQITSLDSTIRYLYAKNKTCDTISVFFLDTINSLFDFEMNVNQTLKDTISLNPCQKTKTKRRTQETPRLNCNISQNGDLFHRLQITFSYPVAQYNTDAAFSLILTKDSTTDTIAVGFHFIDEIQQTLELDYDFDIENQSFTFICPDSLFYNHLGWCNDTIKLNANTKSTRDFGNMQVSFQFYETNHFIAELLNEKNTVIQTDSMQFNKKIDYNNLQPGKYRLRIIVDENNNGRWDSGNYLQRKQPEKVIYSDKTFEILANWKIEETFDVIIK